MPETTPLLAMREAFITRLRGDAPLVALLGGPFVRYRPSKLTERYPQVTLFDFGAIPDATVPLFDRTIQVDVWADALDVVERIAWRIVQLLDFLQAQHAGLAPVMLPAGVARLAFCGLTLDRDDFSDEGATARKLLEFRAMVYVG